MVTVSLGANPSSGSEQTQVVVTAGPWRTSDVKCLHQSLAMLGEVAVKVISLAGITRDHENKILILTTYL